MSNSLQPHGLQRARFPSITNSRRMLKLMSIKSVTPSNHLILCHSLLLLPSIYPTIRVFPNKSVLHIRWPKYWSFSISPSNEYAELISFRIDWLDPLVVQGTLKNLPSPQLKSIIIIINSLALSFLYSPTLMYMTTGKIIALTMGIFVSKVISLLLICCLGLS